MLGAAPAALAQSTMVKGKVIDANKEPVIGVQITIEFLGGVNRKLQTKTDKRGEFIQLLTESGMYRVTATDPDGTTVTLNADGSFTYTPEADSNGVNSETHLGLQGMRERAAILSGTVSVTSGFTGTPRAAMVFVSRPWVSTNSPESTSSFVKDSMNSCIGAKSSGVSL